MTFDNFTTQTETIEAVFGALTHSASVIRRFSDQVELPEPFVLRYYDPNFLDAGLEAFEYVVENDASRFPIGAIVTYVEGEFWLGTVAIRTNSGNEYIVHVQAELVS